MQGHNNGIVLWAIHSIMWMQGHNNSLMLWAITSIWEFTGVLWGLEHLLLTNGCCSLLSQPACTLMVGTRQLNCHVTAGDYELFHDDSSHAGVRWTWQSSFSNNKTAGVKVWRCRHLQGCHTQVAPSFQHCTSVAYSYIGPTHSAFYHLWFDKMVWQKARLRNKAKRLWYFLPPWLPIQLDQRLQPLLYLNNFTNFI